MSKEKSLNTPFHNDKNELNNNDNIPSEYNSILIGVTIFYLIHVSYPLFFEKACIKILFFMLIYVLS